ncbi:2-polyprenyl-6-methoxyphenol hydroxylase [Halorubrum aquaticum]|uniref:2-polyprenyl-6-methoxyphenol hydroxylase n=1 Tax=Halorubrum aquaticum TaxID=387340 RepID=A0A1I3AF40_9EURY|nr:FAD-dependent monooxygenase [Halorubrum aquaticum]SFH47941.1 2-polyprenyl-6-methoxyphenol hydroxylase [Halorubrum aquaticum]
MVLEKVTRYDRDRASTLGSRAVVLGGSVAGLCAARVLADAFEEVVVIERDRIPETPSPRDGAPQTRHPHAMLEAGRATIEDLFPGFGERLLEAGGLLLDASREMRYYDGGDFLADPPERLPMYCASRALFEHAIREGIERLPSVTQRGDRVFTSYETDDDGSVAGVEFRDDRGGVTTLPADLVVDATGRASRTSSWLEANGYEPPPTESVEVDVTYSTIRVERPGSARHTLVVPPDPPRTRGAAAIPIEGGRWEVILQGVHGDDAPTDPEALVAFAESFPVPEVAELVRDREWTEEGVHHYPFPSSVRRRYDRLDRFPDGLVVTGDAIASFNPIYGQGMSVAALDALALHHALATGGLDDLAPRFFDRTAGIVEAVWRVAVGADFAFEATAGPKPTGTDAFNRYVDRLVSTAHDDGRVTDAYYRVFRLEREPTSLLRPGVLWRVLAP